MTLSNSRSERIAPETGTGAPARRCCDECGEMIPEGRRADARFCSEKCRRIAWRESAAVGRCASVRRLKNGKMSVIVHIADTGLKPGDPVRIAFNHPLTTTPENREVLP